MQLRSFAALSCALLAACGDAPAGADRDRATADVALAGARADLITDAPQQGGKPTVLRFRSIQDPEFPPDPGVCEASA